MEWVETTGKTVEEAIERALDLLGVDEDDAEVEVLGEPKMGLFGKLREEARVKARVRPQAPRPKEGGAPRRRAGAGRAEGQPAGDGGSSPTRPGDAAAAATAAALAAASEVQPPTPAPPRERSGEHVPIEEQADKAKEFLEGLLDAFDAEGEVTYVIGDDDTAHLSVAGEGLGHLIGPRGTTLLAVQDLVRTTVQRRLAARNGRLYVDIGDYRKKRKVALERFSQQQAEEVKATGRPVALEPMVPADRKVVHDAINAIEGVSTVSEGEEPNRRVVILPE